MLESHDMEAVEKKPLRYSNKIGEEIEEALKSIKRNCVVFAQCSNKIPYCIFVIGIEAIEKLKIIFYSNMYGNIKTR